MTNDPRDLIHSLTKPGDAYTCKRCGGAWASVMLASRTPCPGPTPA